MLTPRQRRLLAEPNFAPGGVGMRAMRAAARRRDVIPDSGNLQANHDAQLISGVSGGATLDPWPDEESNNDMSATGDPTYQPNQINGNAAVVGDGNDYYTGGNILGQQQSIYAVVQDFNNSGQQSIASTYHNFTDDANGFDFQYDATAQELIVMAGDGSNRGSTSLSVNLHDGNPYVIAGCFDMDSGDHVVRVTDTESTQSVTSLTVAHGNYEFFRQAVGSGQDYFVGGCGQVFTYNVFHDSSTRDSVVQYLQDYWGI